MLTRGDESNAVPLQFAASQWVDLRDEASYTKNVNRLVQEICDSLGLKSATQQESEAQEKVKVLEQQIAAQEDHVRELEAKAAEAQLAQEKYLETLQQKAEKTKQAREEEEANLQELKRRLVEMTQQVRQEEKRVQQLEEDRKKYDDALKDKGSHDQSAIRLEGQPTIKELTKFFYFSEDNLALNRSGKFSKWQRPRDRVAPLLVIGASMLVVPFLVVVTSVLVKTEPTLGIVFGLLTLAPAVVVAIPWSLDSLLKLCTRYETFTVTGPLAIKSDVRIGDVQIKPYAYSLPNHIPGNFRAYMLRNRRGLRGRSVHLLSLEPWNEQPNSETDSSVPALDSIH